MKGEGLLNTYAVGNPSYCEGLRDSAAMLSDNGTLEELNSLLLTLDDTDVNLNAINPSDRAYDIPAVGATPYLVQNAEQTEDTLHMGAVSLFVGEK